MRYVLRQKFWTLRESFVIQDDAGRDVYQVTGRFFSWGDDLRLEDLAGNELLRIRQKLLSWGATYELQRGDQTLAVVRRKVFTLFRCHFTVDVPGPDDFEAVGSLLDREYQFRRGDECIAEVSKRWFSLTDTYGVEVAPGTDDIVILASAIVIDLVCHGPKN